jgi:hypothetical protein
LDDFVISGLVAKDFSKYVVMQEACIKRSKPDSKFRVERVNKFLENLQKVMESTSDFPLDVLKSGSYYDKTKVSISIPVKVSLDLKYHLSLDMTKYRLYIYSTFRIYMQ